MLPLLSLAFSSIPAQPLYALEPTSTGPSPASYSAFEPASLEPFMPVVDDDGEFPELEYTFIEANYVRTDSDIVNDDIDGWELIGSLELPLNLFLQGTFLEQSADEDVTNWRFGAGWHIGFLRRFDAYGILSVAGQEVDDSANDYSEEGIAGEIGLRMLVTKSFEANARVQWVDIEEDDTGGGLGARFYITDSLSVGARYDVLGDDETVSAGLRFEF